jgi:hypothetical protein
MIGSSAQFEAAYNNPRAIPFNSSRSGMRCELVRGTRRWFPNNWSGRGLKLSFPW